MPGWYYFDTGYIVDTTEIIHVNQSPKSYHFNMDTEGIPEKM